MKKQTKILSLSILLCSVLHASTIDFSVSGLKFNYKETDSGQVLDRETGSFTDMPGFKFSFSDSLYSYRYIFNFEYNSGYTTYKGQTWDGTQLEYKEKDSYLYNTSLTIDFLKWKNNEDTEKNFISLSGGFGYRYWNRGNSGNSGDYDEKYYWGYYLIGGEISYNDIYNFDIEARVYYQQAINPSLKVYLGNGTTLNLGSTYGYRIDVPFRLHFDKNYGLLFEYIYDYWKINKSESKNINLNRSQVEIYEPESKTNNQYINIGFYYNF